MGYVTYDYTCLACNKTFEAMHLRDEKPSCPACQSEKLQRHQPVCAVVNTTTQFLKGRHWLSDQFNDWQLKELVADAKKHGYTPKDNDIYLSQLADFPGDPKAFVNASDPAGHIVEVCKKTNRKCQGFVNL